MTKRKGVGEKLSVLAKSVGLSQTALAEKLEIPSSQVNRFFRGHSDVYSSVLMDILKELGLDVEAALNKELARHNGLEIEEKQTPGEAFEKLVKSFDKTGREAIVDHLGRFADAHLGAKAKTQTKFLRQLI